MFWIISTKMNDFPITIDSRLFIFPAVLAQMALHEPGLGVPGIDSQNAIQKDFGYVPTFFRDCTCSV
jgi:hypothetical protein